MSPFCVIYFFYEKFLLLLFFCFLHYLPIFLCCIGRYSVADIFVNGKLCALSFFLQGAACFGVTSFASLLRLVFRFDDHTCEDACTSLPTFYLRSFLFYTSILSSRNLLYIGFIFLTLSCIAWNNLHVSIIHIFH